MALRETKTLDHYQFHDLKGLRDFLDGMKDTDLETVYPDGAYYFDLLWIEETLSGGSTVNNAIITTR